MGQLKLEAWDLVGAYPTCQDCKSKNVVRDAWASWDIKSNEWVLKSVFDQFDCDKCGQSTQLVWKINDAFRKKRIRRLNDALRQGSVYLHDLTSDTHRCQDTARRQMQKLRAGGFLRLPIQQRATEHAGFNPYIYDQTSKAKDALLDLGLKENTVRPTGHWWHGYLTSCVTSSIDIASNRDGVRYIPAHEILEIKNSNLAITIGQQKLIPDQLFALDYGGRYRAFMLEVDRGTEPKTSASARKSYAKSIEQYRQLIEQDIYQVALWIES